MKEGFSRGLKQITADKGLQKGIPLRFSYPRSSAAILGVSPASVACAILPDF